MGGILISICHRGYCAAVLLLLFLHGLSILAGAQSSAMANFSMNSSYGYFEGNFWPNTERECIESYNASIGAPIIINTTVFSDDESDNEFKMVNFNWNKLGQFPEFFKLKFRVIDNDTSITYDCDRDPFSMPINMLGPKYTFEWILVHDGRPHTGPNSPSAFVRIDNIALQGLEFVEPSHRHEITATIEEPMVNPSEGSIFDSYSIMAKTKNIDMNSGMNLEVYDSVDGEWKTICTSWPNESNIILFNNINFDSWGEKKCMISCGRVHSPVAFISIPRPTIIPESGSNITLYKLSIRSKNKSLDRGISLQIMDNDNSQWMPDGIITREGDNLIFDRISFNFIKSLTLGMHPRCRFKVKERETDEFDGPRIDSLLWVHQNGELMVEAQFEVCGSQLCISDNNTTIKREYTECGQWQTFEYPEIALDGLDAVKVSNCYD